MSRKLVVITTTLFILIVVIYAFFNSTKDELEKETEVVEISTPAQPNGVDIKANPGADVQHTESLKRENALSLESPDSTLADGFIVSCEVSSDDSAEEQNPLNDVEELKANWKKSESSSARTAFLMTEFGSKESFDSSIVYNAISKADSAIEKKLLSSLFINMCGTLSDVTKCTTQAESLANEIDESNGALWFSVAALYAKQGKSEDFIDALNKVVSSPEYNDYWGEAIRTYDGALESVGVTNRQERATSAIGFAAATSLPPVSELFALCERESKNRADIGHLCVNVGERMASSGKTAITQGLGLGLQKKSFNGLGLIDEVERVKKEAKKLYQESYSEKVENLIYFDEELFDYWYNSMLDLGERESFRLTRDEAIRKSKDPSYNPCRKNSEI